MKYSRRELNIEAKKYNFISDTYEKVVRLTEILSFIQKVPLLRDNLALKGGTAINLTIFNLPRLSVDIDLDFTSDVTKNEMLETRSKITEILLKFMKLEGYYLDDKSRYHHALDGFKFHYKNSAGNNDILKVEINYLLRNHIYEPITIHSKDFGLIKPVSIRILHPYEIFGSKLVALITRSTPRDLYDFYNMIQHQIFNEDELIKIRKCAIFYRAISNEDHNFDFDISNIHSITQRDIRRFLNPVIRLNEKFNLNTAIILVEKYFNTLFMPDKLDLQFLRNFQNNIYSPELLFEKNITLRIIHHPMAIWKTNNIK